MKIKINDERDLGRPKLLFSTQDRDRSRVKKLEGEELEEFLSSKKPHTIWEEKIQFIPDFLKETLNYLKESPSIVSIPTARLVIFDILLLFSRISESINPELNKSNKKLEKDDVKEIERIWKEKKHVVFDVDVIGGISLKEYFMENSISIFIKPPSMEVLSERLKKRNTEDIKSIKNRLEKSFEEMKSIDKFDKIILNDELSISSKNIIETVKKFLK